MKYKISSFYNLRMAGLLFLAITLPWFIAHFLTKAGVDHYPIFFRLAEILAFPLYQFYKDGLPEYMALIYFVAVFEIILIFIIFKYKHKLIGIYTVCPNCGNSILVYDNWQCEHCLNFQNKDRYIYQDCVHCKRPLKSVLCEHCEEELSVHGL